VDSEEDIHKAAKKLGKNNRWSKIQALRQGTQKERKIESKAARFLNDITERLFLSFYCKKLKLSSINTTQKVSS
jgi:hypothetical protein